MNNDFIIMLLWIAWFGLGILAFANGIKKIQIEEKKKEELRNTHSVKLLMGKDINELTPFEYEDYCAKRFSNMGYTNVTVTQKSVDYGADVLCVDLEGKKTCIQCKHYKSNVGVKAIQEIIIAKRHYECDVAIVCATSDFTRQAKIVAKENNVILYSRFYVS